MKLLREYLLAVFRHWIWLVISVVLSLWDLIERAFGTWYVAPGWLKIVGAVVCLFAAQFMAYADLRRSNASLIADRDISISRLNERLSSASSIGSKLEIRPDQSRPHAAQYLLQVDHNTPKPHKVLGLYIMFWVVIENTGTRNSNINTFELTIKELSGGTRRLQPSYRQSITATGSTLMLGTDSWLAPGGWIEVPATRIVGPGLLAFWIEGVPNVWQHDALTCELTLRDTQNTEATYAFQLRQYGT